MPNYVTQQPSPDLYQLQRRQKMAEQLLQQSQQPQEGQMISGHYVAPSWTQGLARGLQGYFANKELDATAKAQADLQQQTAQRNQADVSKFADLLKGTPAQTVPELPAQDESGYRQEGVSRQITEIPAVPPDLMEAYKFAATSQNPALQQAGTQGLIQMPQVEAQNQEKRAAREAAFAQQMEVLKQRAEDARVSQAERLQAQQDMQKAQLQFQQQNAEANRANQQAMARLAASLRQPQQAQIIQTDSGPMQLVNGRAVPIVGPDGRPVAGKAAAAGSATEGERKAATLLQRMQNSEAQLEAALKTDKTAAKPGLLSSGLRSMGLEALANTSTPESRQKVEAAQLDILDAALTLGTGAAYTKEQLEGYRKSYFPQIGDDPGTVEDKQARLDNILEAARIAAGRAGGQVTAPALPPRGLGKPKPAGGIVDFGSLK